MAKFYPPIDVNTLEFNSEADMARAMEAQLPDDYIVMHSLPWVFPARDDIGAPAREGEADFVIFHKSYGVLILEVKGGEIRVRNRVWIREKRSGSEPIKDPAKQARRSLWAFKKRIETVCGKDLADRSIISVGVAFPHCLFRDEPPTDLPKEAILTMDDLANVEPAIIRLFKSGGGGRFDLSGPELESVRLALAPEFQIYQPLKIEVDAAAAALLRLTQQQLQILKGFEGNERAIIDGVAGSGKTYLAIQRARTFAKKYPSVLFTCFNSELARWIREQLTNELSENGGSLTVTNFHRLAADTCKEAGIDFTPGVDQQKWWDEIAPDLMAQAAISLSSGKLKFDAIVVDEAQDFSPGWWDALAYLVSFEGSTPMWAFLDRAQSLRREPVDPPITGAVKFSLNVNCRNTRRIVTCANVATKNEGEAFDLAPLGRPPKFIAPQNPAAIKGLVQQEIKGLLLDHRLLPGQIALIGAASYSKGPIGTVQSIENVPITESAADWRSGGSILCTTSRSFKGLEADVIIIYDFAGFGGLFTVSDLYVAMTRARSHLIVIARDRASKALLENALAASISVGAHDDAH